MLFVICYLSLVNYHLSLVNHHLSIINYQLSIINYQLSIIIPWNTPGWFEQAESWIQEQIKHQGFKPIAPIEVVKNWALAIILRVKTTQGSIYFKASAPLFANEPESTRILGELYPAYLPQVIATKPEQHWMLMRSIDGEILETLGDISHWQAALRQWAKFQIDASQHREHLIGLGWLDLGLDKIDQELEKLFYPKLWQSSNTVYGLGKSEPFSLFTWVSKLKAVCHQLSQLELPETLVHGDLSPRNIYSRHQDRGFVYFDWSDTCISHPFFDLIRFLYEIEKDLPHVPDARSRIRNAYLEPWTIYAPMEQLVSTFESAAETLESLYENISVETRNFSSLQENWGDRWQWQAETPVSFYLQRLLIQVSTYLQDK